MPSDNEELALAVHELLRRVRFEDVEEVSCCGISTSECHALEVIALGEKLSVNDVAAAVRLNKSTASRLVRSLEKKGLVRTEADAIDKRGLRVSATREGKTTWRRIVRETASNYAEVLKDCTPAERKAVTRVLRRLAQS